MYRIAALALAAVFLAGSVAAEADAATANTFTPDGAAAELVRLLNGERTTHGLPALAIDPFLAYEARDGAVVCPDGSGTMDGRAKDMAVNNFFSHSLRLCPTYTVLDDLYSWGYRGYDGEIVAMNLGYDFNPYPYTFGCDVLEANCGGASTSAPATVAIASYQFMTSQGHRDIVLSPLYDRFACGAWQTANGAFYSCMFASGPGTGVAPTPSPTPTATPSPSPVPSPSASPLPTLRPWPWTIVRLRAPRAICQSGAVTLRGSWRIGCRR